MSAISNNLVVPELSPQQIAKRDQLLTTIASYGSCAVAFSAGVDSTVVAKAAQLALGDKAVAVTASSASLAAGELEQAKELAQSIGIRHEFIATEEMENADYRRNSADRCYHCKAELYSQLDDIVDRLGVLTVCNGANVDDQGDYRPGMLAAGEHAVHSPLIDCGCTKDDVRALAAHWELPVWDKPAAPCLSSRIAYGEEVTPARLAMIDAAEQFLRSLGLRELRVRYHRGDLARIEVPVAALSQLTASDVSSQIVKKCRELGFAFVTLDLAGFQSGSLNKALGADATGELPLVQLQINASGEE